MSDDHSEEDEDNKVKMLARKRIRKLTSARLKTPTKVNR